MIGGFTDPERSREGLGALLVGYHKGKKLVYAGKVGTGFDRTTLRDLTRKLTALERDSSPFADHPRAVRTHWVEPSLIAQVAYGAWTDDGILRHASFQGLREDKSPGEVTRDKPKKVGGVARRRKPKLAASASRVAAKPPAKMKSDDYDAQGQEFRGVRLTSPDKILYPEQGITKLDLARYFNDVAEWMLPHVADRPLSLVRCPEGRAKACFFQKHPAPGTPKELRHVPIREKNKTETYVVLDDAAGLKSRAQIGASRPRLGLANRQARTARSACLRSRPRSERRLDRRDRRRPADSAVSRGPRARIVRQDDGRQGAAPRPPHRAPG